MSKVRPKKQLGQHFLTDSAIARQIVESLPKDEEIQNVLEIGPGMGILSQYLFEKTYNFKLIEIDEESVNYLKEKYPEHQEQIHSSDFLQINFSDFFSEQEFYIIGNFPYNISSQILFKVYENYEYIPVLVGMFQKEVAERIASEPGTKKYGILSVLLQAYYKIEYLFTVNEDVFSPPPKVKSAVIRLTKLQEPKVIEYKKLFKQIVKRGFNQRRKMLRNSLKQYTSEKKLPEKFATKRPEQLSVDDFIELSNLFFTK